MPPGALRGEEPLADGVVGEAVEPAHVVDEAEAVDAVVVGMVDLERAPAVGLPLPGGAGRLAGLGHGLGRGQSRAVGAGSDLVVRRAPDGLEAFLALEQLDQLLRMLGPVDARAVGEHLLVERLDLADAGPMLGSLLVGDELVARRTARRPTRSHRSEGGWPQQSRDRGERQPQRRDRRGATGAYGAFEDSFSRADRAELVACSRDSRFCNQEKRRGFGRFSARISTIDLSVEFD